MQNELFPWPAEYLLDRRGQYLQRPPSHYQREARHLVASIIYRAAEPMLGELASPSQSMAGVRLLTLLQNADPEMLQLVMDEQAQAQTGFGLILSNILNSSSPIMQNLVKGVNLNR